MLICGMLAGTVCCREHGRRTFIKRRTRNRHRIKGMWHPSKRSFVIPVENSEAQAKAPVRDASSI